jgi:hypothetical protein
LSSITIDVYNGVEESKGNIFTMWAGIFMVTIITIVTKHLLKIFYLSKWDLVPFEEHNLYIFPTSNPLLGNDHVGLYFLLKDT